MNIFKRLFNKSSPLIKDSPKSTENEININAISQFDDVWVDINGELYEGWVTKRENSIVNVVYTNSQSRLIEVDFKIERPYNRDYINQGNKILYLTKEAAKK